MAITKEYIYSSVATGAASNIRTFLQQYAAEYFDSISVSAADVSCNIGDTAFLTISAANGNSRVIVNGQTHSSAVILPWTYGYACEGGVSFSNANGVALTITKDAAGETVVIAVKDLAATVGSSVDSAVVYVAAASSPASDSIRVPNHGTADGMTVLTPFVVPKAMPSFTPSVSILTYSQHVSGTGSAVLDIDGTDYLSNGLWAVKDAANGGSGSADLSAYALKADVSAEAKNRIAADTALQASITALEKKYVDLTSGSNLDTITEPHSYRCTSDIAKTLQNVPDSVGENGFMMDVFAPSDDCCAQHIVWCDYTDYKVHSIIRCGSPVDGTIQWGAWLPFRTSAEGGDMDTLINRSIADVRSNAEMIGRYAFYGCANLESIDFPSATTIDGQAFQGCTNLATVSFPLVTSIGSSAFYYCTNLASADFPLVTSIGTSAFQYCSNLNALILRNATLCTLSAKNAFTGTPIESGTGYIYVPSALVDTYKSATNWSDYAAQIRALEDYTTDGTTTGA